jgi:hypothetical protein
MEKFSAEFRARFSKPGILDEIERAYARLESLKRARVEVETLMPDVYQRGEVPKLPLKLMLLMQNAIRRGLELAESMIRDTNAFTYTPVFTSARSLFELSALIFDAYDRMHAIYEKWDMTKYLEFSEHLDNVILGWKSEEWHPGRDKVEDLALKAKNVLTIIQRIDKKHIPGFLSLYELLSEVAHPNYMGMMEAYCKIGEELLTMDFFDSPTRLDPERISIALTNGQGAIGMLVDTIEKFEATFVAFSKTASENIRDDGSLPAIRDWDKPIR